jgi:hypothetical protein
MPYNTNKDPSQVTPTAYTWYEPGDTKRAYWSICRASPAASAAARFVTQFVARQLPNDDYNVCRRVAAAADARLRPLGFLLDYVVLRMSRRRRARDPS